MVIITSSILTSFHLHTSCEGSWLRVPWSTQQYIAYYWGSARIPKSATYPHEVQVKSAIQFVKQNLALSYWQWQPSWDSIISNITSLSDGRVKYTTLDWSDLGETYEKEGKNYVPMCSSFNFIIHPGIDISPLNIHKSAFLPNWFSRI